MKTITAKLKRKEVIGVSMGRNILSESINYLVDKLFINLIKFKRFSY